MVTAACLAEHSLKIVRTEGLVFISAAFLISPLSSVYQIAFNCNKISENFVTLVKYVMVVVRTHC